MKNKFLKYTLIGICLYAIYFILSHNKLINENIIFAVDLWLTKVFPSLFPMFIINDLLVYSGFPLIISKFFNKFLNKILKVSGTSVYVFIMSIFSGTPSNAIILKNLVANNEITEEEASLTLAFTFFSNPLFLWNILSITFNNNVTLKIILIHYIVNIIIMIIFQNKFNFITQKFVSSQNKSKVSFASALNNSIKKSIDTLLMILGTITFYIVISSIILNCFTFTDTFSTIIKGFLEITQGLNNLSTIYVGPKIKEIMAIAIISFGGLSIHSQIINIISDTNIKYKYFFIGRILHVIFSVILITITIFC